MACTTGTWQTRSASDRVSTISLPRVPAKCSPMEPLLRPNAGRQKEGDYDASRVRTVEDIDAAVRVPLLLGR